MEKRLYRSNDEKIIGGVCGGLGEYFDIDPSIVRVVLVLLFLAHGIGLLAYIIAWIIIPKRPLGLEAYPTEHKYSSWNKYLPGIILLVLGIVLLIRETWYWFDFGEFWPVLLIIAGLFLIFRKRKDPQNNQEYDISNQQVNNTQHDNGGMTP